MAYQLAQAYVAIVPSMKGVGKAIEAAFSGPAKSTGEKAGQSAGLSFSSGFGAKVGAVGGIAASAASKVIDAFAGLSSQIMGASDSTQKFAQTLQFAGVNDKAVKRLTASTQDYANRTVYGIDDIRNTTAQLAANGVPNYDRLAEAAGNLNAVAGGNAETYKSVAMMLTQTAGAGKLTTENWNQLADAIPGASGKLQEAMLKNGAYTGNFRDAMANGEITAQEFNDALMQLGMTDVAKKAAESTATFEGAFGNLEATIVDKSAQIVNTVKPALTGAVSAVSDGVGAALDWVDDAIQDAITWFQDLYGKLRDNGAITTFKQAFNGIARSISGMAGQAVDWAKMIPPDTAASAVKTLADAFKWIVDNGPVLTPILAGIAGAMAAIRINQSVLTAIATFKSLKTAVSGFGAAVKTAGGGLKGLSAALGLGPWGLVATAIAAVVAGLVWFFTQTKTGRKAWSAFTGFLQSSAQKVGAWFTGPFVQFFRSAWNGVKNAWNGVTGFFTGLWDGVADGVRTVAGILSNVWKGVVTGIKTVFATVVTIITAPYIIAWNVLSTMAAKLAPIFQPAVAAIGGFFQDAWTFIQDVWRGVVAWFAGVWTGIVTVFTPVATVLTGFFRSAWTLITGVWSVVVGWFTTVWNGIRNVFSAVPGVIGGFFRGAWNTLTSIWRAAGNWFQSTVWQPIQNGLNAIGKAFESTKNWISASWDQIKDAAARPVRFVVDTVYTKGIKAVWDKVAGAVGLDLRLPAVKFARGGVIPGYTPGRDVMMAAVSGGEAIMRPEFTRALGPAWVYGMNRLARTGGVHAVRQAVMGGMPAYKDGGVIGKVKDVAGAVGHAVGDIASAVADFLADPGAWIASHIVDPVKDMIGSVGGGQIGQIVAQAPVKWASALVDKAKSLVTGMFGSASDAAAVGGQIAYQGGAGVEQWRGDVLKALAMLGQPASWAGTVLRRMNQESGGNPNAINLWDSNAQAGMPSQGLMQTIPGTFNAYAGPLRSRGITDPLANIYAGINYAIHRYGSIAGMNRPGGYADGGIVPMLYDQGGWLPVGRTLVENRTGKPEPVFPPGSGMMAARPQVTQNFAIKVIRSDEDIHTAASILYRNATREARPR